MAQDTTPAASGITAAHLTPVQVRSALETLIELKRPGFVWGPPGIGKSDLIADIAKKRGMELRDVRLNLMDPTDIKGFPVPNVEHGHMEWLPADFLPHMEIEREVLVDKDGQVVVENEDGKLVYEDGAPYKLKGAPKSEIRKVPNDSQGILFLDELNQAPPMVQAAAYQLLLTRKVGGYTLPDGWAMLGAGNRETDRSNAQRMPAALALRLVHIDMMPSVDDWCAWALENAEQVPVELLSFIRFKSDLLHKFDPSRRVSPNPRSWVFCGQLTNAGLDPEIRLAMMQGTVGAAEASEYVAYLGMWQDLPSVEQVKLDPDGTPVPANISAKFGIIGSLARANTKDIYPRLKKYIDRMDAEWQILFHKDALAYNRDFTGTREWQQFAVKHSHLLA
jgi:hypothetical protein